MKEIKLQDAMKRSPQWLLENQDSETGGWADQPGKPVSTLNTAEAIIGVLGAQIVQPGNNHIQKAVKFLERHWCDEGDEKSSWPREVSNDKGRACSVPDIVRTSFSIQALIKAGRSNKKEQLKDSLKWLLDLINNNGGWGYRRGSDR